MCKYKSGQHAGFFSALIISSLEHHFFANQANIFIIYCIWTYCSHYSAFVSFCNWSNQSNSKLDELSTLKNDSVLPISPPSSLRVLFCIFSFEEFFNLSNHSKLKLVELSRMKEELVFQVEFPSSSNKVSSCKVSKANKVYLNPSVTVSFSCLILLSMVAKECGEHKFIEKRNFPYALCQSMQGSKCIAEILKHWSTDWSFSLSPSCS